MHYMAFTPYGWPEPGQLYLAATPFLDFEQPEVVRFVHDVTDGASTQHEQSVRLFFAVRDQVTASGPTCLTCASTKTGAGITRQACGAENAASSTWKACNRARRISLIRHTNSAHARTFIPPYCY